MSKENLEDELCKVIAMYTCFSYEDVKRVYKILVSIDKTIVLLELATANGVSLDYALLSLFQLNGKYFVRRKSDG